MLFLGFVAGLGEWAENDIRLGLEYRDWVLSKLAGTIIGAVRNDEMLAFLVPGIVMM
jgi:hypothetical protein